MDSLEIGSEKEGALYRLKFRDKSMRLPAVVRCSNMLSSDTSDKRSPRGHPSPKRENSVWGRKYVDRHRETCSSHSTLVSTWELFLRSLEEQTFTAPFPHPGSSQAPLHCLPSLIRISSDGEQGRRLPRFQADGRFLVPCFLP